MFFQKRKPQQFVITVPEPCHEDWNKMHAVDDLHRHCDSCAKQVVDFTQMSDDELMLFFRSNQRGICGRFEKQQVNRVMPFQQKHASTTSRSWKALFLLPFALLAKHVKGQTNDSVPVVDSIAVATRDSIAMPADSIQTVGPDSIPNDTTIVAAIDSLPKQPESVQVELVSIVGSVMSIPIECDIVAGYTTITMGDVNVPAWIDQKPFDPFPMPSGVIPLKDDTPHLQNIPPGVTDKDPFAKNERPPNPAIPPDSWFEAILPAAWRIKRKR